MRLPAAAGACSVPTIVFSALAGVIWYLQFFFYSMGAAQMGRYGFSSWTLHMASIIIFSTLWGIALREWKGTSRRTHALVGAGLAILIGSTVIVGYGNFIKVAAVATVVDDVGRSGQRAPTSSCRRFRRYEAGREPAAESADFRGH